MLTAVAKTGTQAMDAGASTASVGRQRKVWIDLDNSPHVPFFVPIIEELRNRGYSVLVTVRDCFQTCALADLHKLGYKRVGRHYGKHKIFKLAGLCTRTAQLAPTVLSEKPDVALSHGSRSQILLSALLRVPSIVIFDYEFVKGIGIARPNWVMSPAVVHAGATANGRAMTYPGIKEDVYVPRFRPDPAIRTDLGLSPNDLVVTVRPPANEAHYHNPESEILLEAVFDLICNQKDAKIVLLPRNRKQEISIRKNRADLFTSGKMIIPDRVVDGLNLIWHSDLVISGGGTMNREAAALGIPVYSIFRSKTGAVDRHLAETGRLVMLETVEDVRKKISLQRRSRPAEPNKAASKTLTAIVNNIVTIVETECRDQ